MCFMREYCTGLRLSSVAPKLSESNIGVEEIERSSSWHGDTNQIVLDPALEKALYSASIDDLQ